LTNATQFGIFGLRISLKPTIIHSLSHNSVSFTANSLVFIDNSFRIEMNSPQSGFRVYSNPYGRSNLDYSWFFLVFGGGLVFLWGFFTFRNKEYFRFLLNYCTPKTAFTGIILGRIIALFIFFVITKFSIFSLIIINGIKFTIGDIQSFTIFSSISLITIVILKMVASLIGSINSQKIAIITASSLWFLIVLFVPEIFNVMTSKNIQRNLPSNFSKERNKLRVYSLAQESLIEKISKVNEGEDIREFYKQFYKDYLESDFLEILKIETDYLNDLETASQNVHLVGIFTPATFYKSNLNELSGNGYNSYVSFTESNIENYRNFVKYCIDNRLNHINPKDDPFIKNDDEYVFQLKSSLPHYFGLGLAVNLFYILVLLFFAYFRFKRVVFPVPENSKIFENLELDFQKGHLYKFQDDTENTSFTSQLFNTISGQCPVDWKLTINGKKLSRGETLEMGYLPSPDVIPSEIKIKTLISMAQKSWNVPKEQIKKFDEKQSNSLNKKVFGDLTREQKIDFLVQMVRLKNPAVYFIHKLFFNTSSDYAGGPFIEELLKSNPIIIESEPPSSNNIKHKLIDRLTIIHEISSKFEEIEASV